MFVLLSQLGCCCWATPANRPSAHRAGDAAGAPLTALPQDTSRPWPAHVHTLLMSTEPSHKPRALRHGTQRPQTGPRLLSLPRPGSRLPSCLFVSPNPSPILVCPCGLFMMSSRRGGASSGRRVQRCWVASWGRGVLTMRVRPDDAASWGHAWRRGNTRPSYKSKM